MPCILFLEELVTPPFFFELPVPPEVLLGLSRRGHCFCLLVKIAASNIQPETKRRKQKIGSEDKPTAFGLCCLLQARRGHPTSCLLPASRCLLPLLLWPGAVGLMFPQNPPEIPEAETAVLRGGPGPAASASPGPTQLY